TELFETLRAIRNCTSYKDKIKINKIENLLTELEKEGQGKKNDNIIGELNDELICEGCKEEIKELTDKCGDEKMARFLYQCKLNAKDDYYIRWIPFDDFRNIEYLASGGFGEVHKATWVNGYYNSVKNKRE